MGYYFLNWILNLVQIVWVLFESNLSKDSGDPLRVVVMVLKYQTFYLKCKWSPDLRSGNHRQSWQTRTT